MTPNIEKRLLQGVILLACLVPLSAGLAGMILGTTLHQENAVSLDSHFRYLSGLLLGIGCGFISAVPYIETQGARCRLLTAIVVIGGLGRGLGIVLVGMPGPAMLAALGMELIVTPLLCLWQYSLAKRYKKVT